MSDPVSGGYELVKALRLINERLDRIEAKLFQTRLGPSPYDLGAQRKVKK